MGASTSTEQVPDEQREAESLAAATGALPMPQKAFSAMADPETKAIPVQTLQPVSEATTIPPHFLEILPRVGLAIVGLFFLAEKGGISWIEFLRGYVKCSGRISVSTSLNLLCRVFRVAAVHTGLPETLQFESEDAE